MLGVKLTLLLPSILRCMSFFYSGDQTQGFQKSEKRKSYEHAFEPHSSQDSERDPKRRRSPSNSSGHSAERVQDFRQTLDHAQKHSQDSRAHDERVRQRDSRQLEQGPRWQSRCEEPISQRRSHNNLEWPTSYQAERINSQSREWTQNQMRYQLDSRDVANQDALYNVRTQPVSRRRSY